LQFLTLFFALIHAGITMSKYQYIKSVSAIMIVLLALISPGSHFSVALGQAPPATDERSRINCQFPTAIGTKWEYKKGTGKIEFTITKAELKGDDKHITLSQTSTHAPVDFSMIRISKKGVFCTGSSHDSNEHLLLSFETKQNLEWDFVINGNKIGRYQSGTRVYNGTEQVSIANTKYTAHKVTSQIPVYNGAIQSVKPLSSQYWYVDGIGLAKCIDVDGEVIELTSWVPQK
jgi:hypothetical protein